jgi:lipopolysaccharide export system protein LptA
MNSKALVLAVAALLPLAAAALQEDRNQPIYLEADSVEINEKSGISTYRGGVKVTQGSSVLNADIVHVKQTAEGDRVVAEGQPATFRQRHENRPEPVEGKAQRIEHRSAENLLILTGDAEFHQGGDRFSSNRIEYDTRSDTVKAGQAAAAGVPADRVRIVIQPRRTPPAEAPPAEAPPKSPEGTPPR